jgi:hypothetical protein
VTKNYIYAVRDKATGKLVNDITNPGHKFWEKKGNCVKAIKAYNNRASYRYFRTNYEGSLELVTFELVEVKNDDTNLL